MDSEFVPGKAIEMAVATLAFNRNLVKLAKEKENESRRKKIEAFRERDTQEIVSELMEVLGI